MSIRSCLLVSLALALPSAILAEPVHDHAHHAPAAADDAASAAVLARSTAALARFRDPAVAEAEGYRKPWRNDGFMMGEHWYHPELLTGRTCDLARPGFLQYLVIDGQRTLIGTGYVCDAPPDWFGAATSWHRHGPALCRTRKGAFMDFQYLADALPNARNEDGWQDYCELLFGTPEQREIAMLHTWNWIPHPDGALVHENRAIPFLRAGLRVPERAFLDSADGMAALETLRLAHGEWLRRYNGGFLVADIGWWRRLRARGALNEAQRAGEAAVAAMREAEARGDDAAYRDAARDGAAEAAQLAAGVEAKLAPDELLLVRAFLASLVVHDHGM